MGLGLEGAYGVQGGWDALHSIISERRKQELLAQKAEEERQRQLLEWRKFEEDKRQFGVTNQRLEEAAGIVRKRQEEQDTINKAARIESSSAIGDPLTPDKIVALQQAGAGNAIQATPILPGVGLIEKIGAKPTIQPGTETGGQFEYGGTSQQRHQEEADRRAEQAAIDARKRAEEAAARGDKALAISEQRLGLAEQAANREVPIYEKQPDGSYAVVSRMEHGGQLGPNPETTFERNQRASRKAAGTTISAIENLSAKINVNQGVYAKITGAAERAKAQANLNDDVAEYESLIQAFTPLVARALGHTGVLTEQDVQSTRQIFPKPTDPKSLRDRKIARLRSFFQLEEGEGGAAPPPAAGGAKHLVFDPASGELK
jgi:hypothetical protein